MKKLLSSLHSLIVPALSIAWIIAMINLWQWNVEGTGLWFAFAMVFLGVVVLTASLLNTFAADKKNKFFRNLIDKIKKKK